MTLRTAITTTLLSSLLAACSATDAPTVEFTNSGNKNDQVDLTFELDAGESVDIGLDCAMERGCDIMLTAYDQSFAAFNGSIDVALYRPDGFSRTDSLYDGGQGAVATAYFAQDAGYYTVTVTNNTGEDRRVSIGATWLEARPDVGAPNGAACSGSEGCGAGQACLGAGDGQIGFCSSSCSQFGQLLCDQAGDLCVPTDEAGTQAYCFKGCSEMSPDCGGEHLECFTDAGTDQLGNTIGVCSISAAAEMPDDGVDNDGDGVTD